MWIRYFAATDDSDVGGTALAFLKCLCRCAAVRLVSTSQGMSRAWSHFAALTMTPMHGRFVNVVCTTPDRWTWTQTIAAPTRDLSANAMCSAEQSTPTPTEIIRGRIELYTVGVNNVLIASRPGTTLEQIETSMRYENVIVPDVPTMEVWRDRVMAAQSVRVMHESHIDEHVLLDIVLGH